MLLHVSNETATHYMTSYTCVSHVGQTLLLGAYAYEYIIYMMKLMQSSCFTMKYCHVNHFNINNNY